ncbi:hypothetical protein QJS10_CPA06g00534 [Acorus calamus]|uniref:RINT1-like protein MAG2 n=1 Tax=Acorus calamus TaxID=4465 RepID=A0AAV9EM67_ACOCL|nr:hypothetical protein QJS10_CPA06g00534 [Acorus calamus]
MDLAVHLPRSTDLSPSLLSFLDVRFRTKEDLSESPNLSSELRNQCSDLESDLQGLHGRLASAVDAYASHSERIGGLFEGIRADLINLRSTVRDSGTSLDGTGVERTERREQILALAKEVARVETVRSYAETALKLDSLIGDVEDAVSTSVAGKFKQLPLAANSEETRLIAIKFLKQIEDILTCIKILRPQWTHLLSAVDHRVDRALAVLRPQAIADHRALLASFGWPPPLLGSGSVNSNAGNSPALANPLLTMKGDHKTQYCENFLALCNLQELQRQRKSRQLEGHNLEIALRQPLWAIEELVNPIYVASQRHFSKWVDKPELIFTLIYKITRDFVDSMDEILQPLVDKARLSGYSCREEWVSSMVTSLSTYLAKEIFPVYVGHLEEDSSTGIRSPARISWLHLVDSMIAFDKRILSLITNSGLLISIEEDDNLQRISSMSVFCDRPDWFEIWMEIELDDVLMRLKPEIEDEKNWSTKIQGAALLGYDDYRSPAVSGAVLRHLSAVIDRCRPLPSVPLRARFIRLVGAPIVKEFLDCQLRRCQEAEGLTALADDDALIKVSNCVNATRYFESVLKEWSEDVFFIEMALSVTRQSEIGSSESIFEEEILKMKGFRTEWLEKISTVILRGFEARCRDYFKNKKQWQDKAEEVSVVSQNFISVLDYLQGKISKLEGDLNEVDFVGLWRSLANAVDQLIFAGVLMSNAKFHDGGVERFRGNLEVLFGVFRSWCLRPEGFFPKLNEGLRLLKMEQKHLRQAIGDGKEKWLRDNGIKHLTSAEAEKIAKHRVFKI